MVFLCGIDFGWRLWVRVVDIVFVGMVMSGEILWCMISFL